MSRRTILGVTMSVTGARSLDRSALLDRFSRARARTRALFDLLEDGAYYERPIPLRNPVVFYEGHVPAFSVNTLIKKGLGRAGVDEHLERVFARGIDPEAEATAVARGNPAWPGRDEVRGYVEAADRLVADAIRNAEIERDGHPPATGRAGNLDDPRARGDAPGDARLHVAPAAVRAQAEAAALRDGPAGAAGASSTLAGARARGGLHGGDGPYCLRVGQRAAGAGGARRRVHHRCARRDQRRVPRVRRGGRGTALPAGGGPTTGRGSRRRGSPIRSSGRHGTATGPGAGCSRRCRCRLAGRST